MNMPRRLNRPNFEADEIGGLVDPDYLSPELKKRLWALLPKRLEHGQSYHFLAMVGESLQLAESFHVGVTAGEQLAQLQRIQAAARELLQAIARLSPDTRANLRAHSTTLALGSSPPAHLSEMGARVVADGRSDLFGYFWDAAQDVETTAAHAASYFKLSTTDRPSQENARRLTKFIAQNFYVSHGSLPPRSKGTWFPDFMAAIGKEAGYSIGLALVTAVVDSLEASNEFPAPAGGVKK